MVTKKQFDGGREYRWEVFDGDIAGVMWLEKRPRKQKKDLRV